ncbi:MAG: hypothetical protein HOV81_19330 [Kofleriaceae bacterium]|nr:hypothetical protein [Kofleriaceae bacterium]
MSEQKQEGVVDLVDAGVPADQGLSSLGMLMQLAGSLFAATVAMMAISTLFAMRGNGEMLWMLLLFGACVARSLFHRAAGTVLLYGSPQGLTEDGANNRLHGVRRYVIVAFIHTLVVFALLVGKMHVPTKFGLGVAASLAVWPTFLAIMLALPRFKRFAKDIPLTEDKGFEGASILMTILGLCGVAAMGALLLFLLDLPGSVMTRGPGVLVALSLGMLVVRSILHVQAGLAGLRETSLDRSVELVNRYANFGVISSFCGCGALLLFFMTTPEGIGGIVIVCALGWMLMSWPLIVRRFFSDRQFADLLAGDQAHLHRRAPDAGLTSLGWLLVALAMYSASILMLQFIVGEAAGEGRLAAFMAFGGGGGPRSIWFSVGLTVLQGWAGYELVRMSPQSRIVATVFGVVGTATTLYINWPLIQALKHLRGLTGFSDTMLFGPLAISLIVPVATVVLVNRKIAPAARARFRTKPAPTPPGA